MNNEKGMGMVGLMIALVIVCGMFYLMLKNHRPDNANQKLLEDTAVNTTNYKTILDSTKRIAHDASRPRPDGQ